VFNYLHPSLSAHREQGEEEYGSKMVEALEKFLKEKPEEAKKVWEEVEAMRLTGPTVPEFLSSHQSEEAEAVDIDKIWLDVLNIFTRNSYYQYSGEERVRMIKPEAFEELKQNYTIFKSKK
jgi:uncharacterized ParB-like nuclease family protein